MSDRPSRGTSWSSNCFQTSSAFGFLFFIFRSRVGIRGVESPDRIGIFDRKLTVHRQEKGQRLNAGNTESTDVTEKKELASRKLTASQAGARHAAPLQGLGTIRTSDVGGQLLSRGEACRACPPAAGRQRRAGRMRRKKKKGETVVEPQFHPRVIIPELKRFGSAIFRKFYAAWASQAPRARPPTSWSVSCASSRSREDKDRSTSDKEVLSPPPVP